MLKIIAAAVILLQLNACASLVSSATSKMADNITQAMLNQNDPATVRDGAPAYLLMIDGLISGDPENVDLLLGGAKLYGAYAGAFVEDEARARRLAEKSFDYAKRALCLDVKRLCDALGDRLDEFVLKLEKTRKSDIKVIYGLAEAWAGWIRVNASDWNAIADISRLKALLRRCVELDERFEGGGAHMYLGVLESQLPAALGGKPELGRQHFERALEISEGKNLMVSLLMAQYYARLVFDRELHDSLLTKVKAAEADYPGYTMINMLAKQQAEQLLAESDSFF